MSVPVLLGKIPLRQDEAWTALKEEQTRQALFGLKVFKEVKISSVYVADKDVVDVDILAKDGWFFLPLPFYGSNKGGQRLSLTLMEVNFFRNAESLFLMGSLSPDTNMVAFGGFLHDWFLYSAYKYTDIIERQYADGGYNSGSFYTTSDQGTGPFPTQRSYTKRLEGPSLVLGRSIGAGYSLSSEFASQRSRYFDGNLPGGAEEGMHNSAGLKLGYRAGRDMGRGNFAQSFGAIFGMGMADLQERIKILPRPIYGFMAEAGASSAGRALGSDYAYSLLSGRAVAQAELPERHTVSLRAAVAHGNNLPFSQLLATRVILQGTYEREFRGDTLSGVGASFAYFLSRSRRGVWVAEPFFESAIAWDGVGRSQYGAGMNMYYRFWRFPLPLGLSYTYSLKDMRGQVAATLGMGFR
ncbi:MAG TPA: hypothetical protein PLL10_02800 [Elusimicrobiales bacterium]|nr:hypothetical protein [Elusimicrobiales bacterium]